MRSYELMCVIQPDLDEAAFNEAVDKIKGWITQADGKVDKVDVWGKRKLAYPIQKQSEGQYVLMNVNLPSQTTAEVERNIRFMEVVMRHMLTAV